MKTQQELMQAYWGPGGMVDMVKEYNAKHGCDVKPWECVKSKGTGGYSDHPGFYFTPSCYEFAVAILYDDKRKEHRTVFVGDKVYHKEYGIEREIVSGNLVSDFAERFSWNPPTPKRTFKIEIDEKQLELLITVTRPFCTGNHWSELFTLLTAARDKE